VPASVLGAGNQITPSRQAHKRGSPDSEENTELREHVRVLRAQLDSALAHIEGVTAIVELRDKELVKVCLERDLVRSE